MLEANQNLVFDDCKKSCTDTKIFSNLENQTILITGGTGFIGKWMAEMIAYLNQVENLNIKLYLLSRNSEKFKNEVPHLAEKSFIKLIEQDIRNLNDLPVEVNYIIHAAGSPDNRDHVSQPLKTIETFYKGTSALLNAATRLPILKKIIHISSHQIYGKNETEDFIKESFSGILEPNTTNNVYCESKRIAETLCSVFKNQFRLPIVIVRPFSFIGPYQDLEKPWAINNFIRDGILGGPIRILGNGLTLKSYLYASDMAYWIMKALLFGQSGEAYNLGSKEAISLNDLAEKVQSLINPGIEILSKSSKENYSNTSRLVPDNNKIVRELTVMETHTIEESLNNTIVWNQLNRK